MVLFYSFKRVRNTRQCCWLPLISLFVLFSCQDPLPDYSATQPDAPDSNSIKITNVTDQSATISWAAAKGADSYRIYLSTDPNFLTLTDSFPQIHLSAKPYTATGLRSNSTYYAKVQSVSTSNGISAAAQVQFKTSAGDDDIYLNFGFNTRFFIGNFILNLHANNPNSIDFDYTDSESSLSVPIGGDQLIVYKRSTSNQGFENYLKADSVKSINRHSFQVNWSSAVAATSVPSAANNILYLGAGAVEVALDATNGRTIWSLTTGGIIRSTAVFSGGYLFFTATDGYLYCTSAATGALIWKKQIGASYLVSSPSVVNGLVVVGSDDSNVYALDINGNVQWTYKTGDAVLGSPMIANNLLYISSTDGSLYCLDLLGEKKWVRPISNRLTSSPVWHAASQSVLVADPDNSILYSFNASSGNEKWKLALQDEYGYNLFTYSNSCSPIVAGSNDIYIIANRRTALYRVKPDGTVVYRYTLFLAYYRTLLGPPVIYDSNNMGYYARTFASF